MSILEQGQRGRAHLERVLLVCGGQNAGKSRLLRTMFVDPCLGTGGRIPTSSKIKLARLSRERGLYVRCTSPHEYGDTIDTFFQKLDRAMERAWWQFWRINIACAMQPAAADQMSDVVTVCREFRRRLKPERVRLVQIDPRQDNAQGTLLTHAEVDQLRHLEVEVVTVDGRRSSIASQHPNGLFLADFFDFT
jgi:hypothetical protein